MTGSSSRCTTVLSSPFSSCRLYSETTPHQTSYFPKWEQVSPGLSPVVWWCTKHNITTTLAWQQVKIGYEPKKVKNFSVCRSCWIPLEKNTPASVELNLSEIMHVCKHESRTFRDSGQRCPSQIIKWLNETLVATMPFKQTFALFTSFSCYLVMHECDYCSLVWMQLLC